VNRSDSRRIRHPAQRIAYDFRKKQKGAADAAPFAIPLPRFSPQTQRPMISLPKRYLNMVDRFQAVARRDRPTRQTTRYETMRTASHGLGSRPIKRPGTSRPRVIRQVTCYANAIVHINTMNEIGVCSDPARYPAGRSKQGEFGATGWISPFHSNCPAVQRKVNSIASDGNHS
jgi:hypothetical protein